MNNFLKFTKNEIHHRCFWKIFCSGYILNFQIPFLLPFIPQIPLICFPHCQHLFAISPWDKTCFQVQYYSSFGRIPLQTSGSCYAGPKRWMPWFCIIGISVLYKEAVIFQFCSSLYPIFGLVLSRRYFAAN